MKSESEYHKNRNDNSFDYQTYSIGKTNNSDDFNTGWEQSTQFSTENRQKKISSLSESHTNNYSINTRN